MKKRCKLCGCDLDPGEWCDCDEQELAQPEMEMRRPVTKRRTVYPREYNSPEYIEARWREFDMR